MAFTSVKELIEMAAEIAASTKPLQDGPAEAQQEKVRAEPEREAPLKRVEQDLKGAEERTARPEEAELRISRILTVALKSLNELRDALKEQGVHATVVPIDRRRGMRGYTVKSRNERMGEMAGITFENSIGGQLRSSALMFLRGRSTQDPAASAVYVTVIRDREHDSDPILLEEIQVNRDVPDEYIQLCIQTFRGLLEAELEAAGGRRRALQQSHGAE